ncbi:MAG: N-acetylmuramoyl-L-alanine amidase [Phycisphaerae bacterium]|nr:N-acetylmuramoyl-L-alanine amidase [Phycisphaerae bacterium]
MSRQLASGLSDANIAAGGDAAPDDSTVGDFPHRRRRAFCAGLGLLALAGCAQDRQLGRNLPSGDWGATPTAPPINRQPVPLAPAKPSIFPGVMPRSAWARGQPEPSLMNPMLPVRYVTVHHDGLDRLETGTAGQAMADRIELYRSGHRAKGWGDIGYHFVIDRGGAVWEGRELKWQGAHVKDRNEGNVGILVMGNFEIQRPTQAQLLSLRNHLRAVCAYFTVPWERVFSHREWPGAQTLCPGQNLQREFVALRGAERNA